MLLFGYILLLLYGVQFQQFRDVDIFFWSLLFYILLLLYNVFIFFFFCIMCLYYYYSVESIVSNLNSLKTLTFLAIVGLFWYLHNLFALIQLYR